MLARALLMIGSLLTTPALASETANKQLVAGVFKALETGDVAALNAAFTPDARNHIGAVTRPRGGPHKTFAEAASFASALEARRVTVFDVVADGDLVAVRSRLCGTHSNAPLLGIAPTGRQICSDYMNLYRMKAGRITDNHVSTDRASVEAQLKSTERG